MKHSRIRSYLAAAAFAVAGSLSAQGVDSAMLLNPPVDSWPGYHGDYSGQRHSRLTQITRENVAQMGLAWAFQTGQAAALKCSPLLVDGVFYISIRDHVWAGDERS